MKNFCVRASMIALAAGASLQNPAVVSAQSQGTPYPVGGGNPGTSTSSATGINSATTQSPSSTFQMQNSARTTQVKPTSMTQQNAGTMTPLNQPTGLIQNHSPVIKPNSFGVPAATTDLSRQAVSPNMLSTPHFVQPQQVNRSTTTPTHQLFRRIKNRRSFSKCNRSFSIRRIDFFNGVDFRPSINPHRGI